MNPKIEFVEAFVEEVFKVAAPFPFSKGEAIAYTFEAPKGPISKISQWLQDDGVGLEGAEVLARIILLGRGGVFQKDTIDALKFVFSRADLPSVGFHSPGWAECLGTGNPIPISADFEAGTGAVPVRDLNGDVWWGILPDAD